MHAGQACVSVQEEKAQREQLEARLSEVQQSVDGRVAQMQAAVAAQLAAEAAARQQAEAQLAAAQQQVIVTCFWGWLVSGLLVGVAVVHP